MRTLVTSFGMFVYGFFVLSQNGKGRRAFIMTLFHARLKSSIKVSSPFQVSFQARKIQHYVKKRHGVFFSHLFSDSLNMKRSSSPFLILSRIVKIDIM